MTRDEVRAWLKLRQEEWRDGRWWVAVRYGRKVVGHYSDGALLREEVVTDGFACGLMVGRLDAYCPAFAPEGSPGRLRFAPDPGADRRRGCDDSRVELDGVVVS